MNYVVSPLIRLIVGLGNPGPEYIGTRHNVGFELIDRLLPDLPGSFESIDKYRSQIWRGRVRGRGFLLQKPMTFMNLSGEAVAPLLRKEQLSPEELLLIYDDVDLPLGKIRFRAKGGSSGHLGVESVIRELGSADFARLRIGIGRREGSRGQKDHVLSQFDELEKVLFDRVVKVALEALRVLVHRGLPRAMNEFNGIDLTKDEV